MELLSYIDILPFGKVNLAIFEKKIEGKVPCNNHELIMLSKEHRFFKNYFWINVRF